MFREDYNKLLEVAEEEFKYPYFLSSPLTENNFWRTHAQIRNSQTTGYIKDDLKRNNNKGIFIDIFVLDELPDNDKEKKKFVKKIDRMSKIMARNIDWENKFEDDNILIRVIKKIYLKLIRLYLKDINPKDWFIKYNEFCAKYNNGRNKKVTYFSLGYREKVVWNKDCFEETEEVEFENMKIVIPKGYNEILSIRYGNDYMKIPKKHPDATHGGIIFDAEIPYKEYIEKLERKRV